jgi:transposase
MEAIIERCCGLDVHQATVVACVLVGKAHEKPRKEIRTFGTFRRDLEALAEWMRSHGCTHVAMESTGVYWEPIYAVLEGSFEIIVGNPRRIKNVPGRKTDVCDAQWIADLARHGLIAKSFVPPKPLRELRALLRYRTRLVQSRTAERNRLQALLERANIKIASVITDIFGVSGMLMLKALVDGSMKPAEISKLARGKLRKKIPTLEPALDGRLEEHHRFMLRLQLKRLQAVDEDIAELEQDIDQKLTPYKPAMELLAQIPGVDWVVAAVLVAEIGTDMTAFGSPTRLASWAGVCPGNNESAGKKKSSRATKGNAHLRAILVQGAVAASRKRGSYFRDKYYRLKARRGANRAALAIAHKILVAVYHMLSSGQPYKDLGDAYLDSLSKRRTTNSLVDRLKRLGYDVTLKPKAAPALPASDPATAIPPQIIT